MAVEPEFVLVQPDVFFVDNVSKVPQTPPWCLERCEHA